jgi:enoyl-CoA hydratase
MSGRYDRYQGLKVSMLEPRLLQVMFERPGRLNALTGPMHGELAEIWRDVDADPEVSVVLLRGAGGTFSAGGDLGLVQEMAENFDARVRTWKETKDIVYNIINCSKPIVSAIDGPAVGAGLAAGLLADVSIAARSARIIDGHTRLGVAAGDHAAIVWPLLCGMAKAKYYALTCDAVSGEEAERIGLISLVADDDKLHETALQVCRKLLAGSPSAIRWTKYAMNNWLRMAGPTFDASLALEMLGMTGPDVKEGVQALREKRRPAFDPDCPM